MKEIVLSCGSLVLVDEEDYDHIVKFYDLYIDKHGYVACRIKKEYKSGHDKLPTGTLHRVLMKPPKGKKIHVDHINGNKLDNRRKENLRICTHQDNMRNRKPQGLTSKYKGVYWHNKQMAWRVQISVDGRNIPLGKFTDELTAANCYNYYALKYHGAFAKINEDIPFMTFEEWNSKKQSKNKTSQYIGVSYMNGFYKAQIWDGVSKKNLQLGEFEKEEDAARSYNKKAIELKGNKAKLNIIKE